MEELKQVAQEFNIRHRLIVAISTEMGKQNNRNEFVQDWSEYDRLVAELAAIDPRIAGCYRRRARSIHAMIPTTWTYKRI